MTPTEAVPTSVFNQAVKECEESNGYNFKVAAVIYKGRRVLAKAANIMGKTCPNGSGVYSTCHAEIRAIKRAKKVLSKDLNGLNIFILRLNQNYQLKPSKPCRYCAKVIEEHGLNPIWID